MKHGLRNIKQAQSYIAEIKEAEEQQWLELLLFHLLLYESRRPQSYEYDCDALYVVHSMQGLWKRPGILTAVAQGILLPNSMPSE